MSYLHRSAASHLAQGVFVALLLSAACLAWMAHFAALLPAGVVGGKIGSSPTNSALAHVDLRGSAVAEDGATLRLANLRVHLLGVAAPEGGAQCADDRGATLQVAAGSRQALGALIAHQPVSCEVVGPRRGNDVTALCEAGNIDLGGRQVASGMAAPLPSGPQGYVWSDSRARQERLGRWACFTPPSPQSPWRASLARTGP